MTVLMPMSSNPKIYMLQVGLLAAGIVLFVLLWLSWYSARQLLLRWVRRHRNTDDFDARMGVESGDRRLTAAHHLRSAVRVACEIPDYPVRPDDNLDLLYGIDTDARFIMAAGAAKAMRQPELDGIDWLAFKNSRTIRAIAEFIAKRET